MEYCVSSAWEIELNPYMWGDSEGDGDGAGDADNKSETVILSGSSWESSYEDVRGYHHLLDGCIFWAYYIPHP
jgi:hypothetical protein